MLYEQMCNNILNPSDNCTTEVGQIFFSQIGDMKTEDLSNELCKYKPVLSELVLSRIQCNCNTPFQARACLAKKTRQKRVLSYKRADFFGPKLLIAVLKRSVE